MERTLISNTPGVVFAPVTLGKRCDMIGFSLMMVPGVEMFIRAISSFHFSFSCGQHFHQEVLLKQKKITHFLLQKIVSSCLIRSSPSCWEKQALPAGSLFLISLTFKIFCL